MAKPVLVAAALALALTGCGGPCDPLNAASNANPAADAGTHGREGHVVQRPDPDAGL